MIKNGKRYDNKYLITLVNGIPYNRAYPFTDEFRNVIRRAQQQGYTLPSKATLVAADMMVKTLKDAGLWAKIDAFYNFAYNNASLQSFSRINWKNPMGNLATPLSSPTYTISGWEFNGSNSYINTNFNIVNNAVNFSQNSASRFLSIYKDVTSTEPYMEGTANADNTMVYSATSTLNRINSQNTNVLTATTTGLGLKGIARDNSTTVRIYNSSNNTTYTTNADNSATLVPNNLDIGRTSNRYSNVGVSMYGAGASLTTLEFMNVRAIYNIYLSRIGLPQY